MAVEYPRRAVIVEGLAAPRGQRRARRREDLGRAAKAVVPLKDALREVWTGGLGDITTLYLGNFFRLTFAETCEKASSSSVSNEVTTRYEPTCERHVSHGSSSRRFLSARSPGDQGILHPGGAWSRMSTALSMSIAFLVVGSVTACVYVGHPLPEHFSIIFQHREISAISRRMRAHRFDLAAAARRHARKLARVAQRRERAPVVELVPRGRDLK